MKNLFLILFILFSVQGVYAQAKQKQKEKEKPPTQKEVQDMMKEMQKNMDEMSPEEKKAMDSMGIKMPDIKGLQKTVSGISDAQIKKAVADENRIVPIKDLARINTALSTNLGNAELSAYISKIQLAVLNKLSVSAKSKGAALMQEITLQKASVANTAVALWMEGKPTLALYLMGEACKADPKNAINLNNYASFLTMCGAEQLALPILTNLNKRFPRNSSILNNITQAWLGLGDIQRAEKYADSTVRIYANHPQANMAKCLIEESKGNIPAAIEAARKAIGKLYSNEKENKLNKLGYKLKSEDLQWDRPMPQDPMGLEKFSWPEYPANVEKSSSLEKDWNTFRDQCKQKIDVLKVKQQILEQEYLTKAALRNQKFIEASQKGEYAQLIPGYAAKAIIKLRTIVSDENSSMSFVFEKDMQPVVKAYYKVSGLETVLGKKQEEIDKKYEDKIGEGKENPFAAICKDENTIRDEFLSAANGALESASKNFLSSLRRKTSDLLYYYQYTMWPEQFELAKVNAQLSWLTQISQQKVMFKEKSHWCQAAVKDKPMDSLQNFDDVHCMYVSTLNLGVYKITSRCSELVGEFDFGGVNINMKDNAETNRFSGTVMVGASKSINGPMGTEAEASLAGLIEFDNSGITDWGAIAGVTANAGGVTVAGAEVTLTVNSGISTSGKGILQGINY